MFQKGAAMASIEIDDSSLSKLVIGEDGERKVSSPTLEVSYPCSVDSPRSVRTQDLSASSDKMSAGDFDVPFIIDTLKKGNKRNIKRALRNFHGRIWSLKEEFLEQGGLTPLAEYIKHGRFYYSEPIDILTALLTSHDESIAAFVDLGGVAWVARLLKSRWPPLSRAALKACPVLCSTTNGRLQFHACGGISAVLRFIGTSHSTTVIAANVLSLLAGELVCRKEIIGKHGLTLLHNVDGPKDVTLSVTAAIADIIAVESEAQSKLVIHGISKYIDIAKSFPRKGELSAHATRLLANVAKVHVGVLNLKEKKGISILSGILDLGRTESEFWALCALESIFESAPELHATMEPLASLLQILLAGELRCQQKALCCLQLMSVKDKHSRKQMLSGGVLPLLGQVMSSEWGHQKAVQIVSSLIEDDANKPLMKPVVPSLLKLAESGDEQTQADAVGCLANLSTDDSCASRIVGEGGVSSLVQVLKKSSNEAENWALKCLALLSHDDGFRSQIQASDILSTLNHFLQDRCTRTKCITAICLAKIFDAHPRMKRKFVSMGATDSLLPLLHSSDTGLRGAVLLVLSKITSLRSCQEALSSDTRTLGAMNQFLNEGSDAVKECIALIVADVARVSIDSILSSGIQNRLLLLLDSKNVAVVVNSLSAIQLITEKHPPLAIRLTDDFVWKKLLGRMRDSNPKIKSNAIACLKTISGRACAKMDLIPETSGYLPVVKSLISAVQLSHVACVTEAAATLAALAEQNIAALQSIVDDQKAIQHLVKLLKRQTGDWHEEAAHAVAVLIRDHRSIQLEFVACGGVIPLNSIFNNGSLGSKRYCASIFGSLALNPSALNPHMRGQSIRSMIHVLPPGNDLIVDDACTEEVCRALANMACENTEQRIIAEEDGITKLIEQAQNACEQVQVHAARALANLSCHDEISIRIGKEGGIEVLATLLSSTCKKCKKQAAGGLANLVYKNPENADILLATGKTHILIEMMSDAANEFTEQAFRAIGNLAAASASGKIYLLDIKILPSLIERFLDAETPPAVHESIVQAMASLIEDDISSQELLLRSGLVPPLLQMLKASSGSTRDNIIRILTCLACGDGGLQIEGASDLSSNRAKCAKLMLMEVLGQCKESDAPDVLESAESDQGIPTHLICPITHDIMQDPVIANDGHTYDRLAIQQWFQTKASSPLTNQTLQDTRVVPNLLVASILEDFVHKSGGWSKFID